MLFRSVYNASLGSIIWRDEGSYESNTLVQFSSSSGLFVAQVCVVFIHIHNVTPTLAQAVRPTSLVLTKVHSFHLH